MQDRVGASIVEIVTESLYDKPIVIFREYVQNSADSLLLAEKTSPSDDLAIRIWKDKDSLFFLDNGTGIASDKFKDIMGSIAKSTKARIESIGYKGIGRLSGLSYCQRLTFVNIISYKNHRFQTYSIDCQRYSHLRKNGKLKDLPFANLMDEISTFDENPTDFTIDSNIEPYSNLFENRDTGFVVVMHTLSPVLIATMNDKRFTENLAWLLPVPYEDELLIPSEDGSNIHELFQELSSSCAFSNSSSIPAKAYNIMFNDEQIKRPIKRELLRSYLCRSNLEQYAVCVHTFSNSGIAIDNSNSFSGIRVYIDNMLLCDESELIPSLQQFGMISHTVNETIQTVRGIGAILYIVDKTNISANARRTFIDVTDEDSFNFLRLIGEFVEKVFQARYALSGYYSAKKKDDIQKEALDTLRSKAETALINLASRDVVLEDEVVENKEFEDLTLTEKRKHIKSKISKDVNAKIKRYIEQTTVFNLETYFDDFITWLKVN